MVIEIPLNHPSAGLVISLIVIGLGIWIVYAIIREHRRQKELAEWAKEKGLSFFPEKDKELPKQFENFSLFQQGYWRKAYNVATGRWNGREVLAFDYQYTTGAGKSQRTHYVSAVIVRSEVPLRPLRMRPESFLDQIPAFFGLDDIDFESAEFSREYHVRAPDKRWAYDVLHPRTIEFLLAMPRFWIEMDDMYVIAWQKERFDLATFDVALEVVMGILDRLPEYVVQERIKGGGNR